MRLLGSWCVGLGEGGCWWRSTRWPDEKRTRRRPRSGRAEAEIAGRLGRELRNATHSRSAMPLETSSDESEEEIIIDNELHAAPAPELPSHRSLAAQQQPDLPALSAAPTALERAAPAPAPVPAPAPAPAPAAASASWRIARPTAPPKPQATARPAPPPPRWPVGTTLEALDCRDKWCEAKVLAERGHDLGHEVLVHYVGWKSKWDEWHLSRGHKLRAKGSAAVVECVVPEPELLRVPEPAAVPEPPAVTTTATTTTTTATGRTEEEQLKYDQLTLESEAAIAAAHAVRMRKKAEALAKKAASQARGGGGGGGGSSSTTPVKPEPPAAAAASPTVAGGRGRGRGAGPEKSGRGGRGGRGRGPPADVTSPAKAKKAASPKAAAAAKRERPPPPPPPEPVCPPVPQRSVSDMSDGDRVRQEATEIFDGYYERCGTYGCILANRHPGLHVFSMDTEGERPRKATRR